MLRDSVDVVIRRLRAHEGPLLRDLRIRSLADAPDALGQTLDDARGRAASEWQQSASAASRGDSRAWFLALVSHEVVGLVQGRRRRPDAVLVFSMWVDPAHRRRGVGGKLIDAVEAWAGGWAASTTVLWVFAGNEAAVRFYRSIGFSVDTQSEDAEAGARYGALAMHRSIKVPSG